MTVSELIEKLKELPEFDDLRTLEEVRAQIETLIGKYWARIEANKNLNALSDSPKNISLRNKANQLYRDHIDNLKPILEKLSS